MANRDELIVLGRRLGTFMGWDICDEYEMVFYNFEPDENIPFLIKGDLSFNWDSGQFLYYKESGEPELIFDCIETLANVPRAPLPHDLEEEEPSKLPN